MKQKNFYPMLVLTLCALFLFYKYVLQIFPSVITQELMREFQLTGTGLGNLAATFYYTYVVAQLFVGVILDKYNTRVLTSLAILTCALALLWFANTESIFAALFARGLMGIGVAFATVAYLKLAASWFKPQHYAFVSGLLATAAMAGAVFGQAPLAYMIANLSWRPSLSLIGSVGIGFSILFLIFVRNNPKTLIKNETIHKITLNEIVQIFKNKQNWLLTLYCGLAFTPIAVFGGLWGNPFLEQAYALSKTQTASLLSLVFIGLGLGSPVIGFVSDYFGNRRLVMLFTTLISFLALSAVLYCTNMPIWLLTIMLFVFGFFIGAFMLAFTIGKETNSPLLTATVVAMINSCDALLTAITEPFIGKILDLNWDGKIVAGVHHFQTSSYHMGLSVLPIYLFLACILLMWVKETKSE